MMSKWTDIRDGVVLPLIMQGGVYVVKLVLSKTVADFKRI